MKKMYYWVLFVCAVLITIIYVLSSRSSTFEEINILGDTANKKITFKDKNLFDGVVKQLSGSVSFDVGDLQIEISNEELAKVRKLELNNLEIKSLTGLSNFKDLKELNLANNLFSGITEIKKLNNLEKLNISGNVITNISQFDGLNTSLKYLDISNNRTIEDVSEDNNVMKRISENCTNLEYLKVSHNSMKYLTGIENMVNLKFLDLYDNYYSDINGIEMLINLEYLNLGENNITQNLNSLNNLTSLKELDFSENNNADIINHISSLTNLEKLNLEGNSIENINNLNNLTNLKELVLYNNRISNISVLTNLKQLEYLYLGKNNLTTISNMLENDKLVWNYIRHIGIAENNNIVSSTELEYLKNKSINGDLSFDYENITDTSNLPHVGSDGKAYVTYDDFGARADGTYDDYIAIRNAHMYANANNIEVRADKNKTYHIFAYYNGSVDVNTSVDWNNTTIIIHDEKIDEMSCRFTSLFNITNNVGQAKITRPSWTINKNTKTLTQIGDVLTKYNNDGYEKYYVLANNNTKMQYIRYGHANAGKIQSDVFMIDNHGNILNDIQWDFNTITSMLIYPIPNKKLYIKNANFISNTPEGFNEAAYSRTGKNIYYRRNLSFAEAFNIEISGIRHEVSIDEIAGSYSSFVMLNRAADILFKDSYLFARKNNWRSGYDLNFSFTVNAMFENISSNNLLGKNRWGIIGSNYSKDITFDRCAFNRIDSHAGLYNLTVKNTNVGIKSLTLTGQNKLIVENTTVTSSRMVTLRSDYGSTWDGDMYISNSIFKYIDKVYSNDDSFRALLNYKISLDGEAVHEFGYELHLPNIYVENLTIDSNGADDSEDLVVIYNSDSIKDEIIPVSYFPDNIYINKYNFINNPNNRIKLFTHDADYFVGNYVITDLELKANNEDFTHNFNIGETFKTDKSVSLMVKEQNSSANTISIYKDNSLLIDNVTVSGLYNYNFFQEGIYRIVLKSYDVFYNKEGIKEFTFEIAKISPTISLYNKNSDYTGQETKIDDAQVTLSDGNIYDGNINYSYYVGNSCSGNAINYIPVNSGEYSVKATVEESEKYSGAESNCAKLTINKKNPILTLEKERIILSSTNEDIAYNYDGDGELSCSSTNKNINCSIDKLNKKIKIVKESNVLGSIEITGSSGENYNAISKVINITNEEIKIKNLDIISIINNNIIVKIPYNKVLTYKDVMDIMEIKSEKVEVYNTSNQKVTDENSIIGTGARIELSSISYPIIVNGDITGDAKITALDYISIRNHMMGTSIISDNIKFQAGDMNKDNKISALDYIAIRKIMLEEG